MLNTAKKLQKIWDFGEVRTAIAAVCAHSVSISIGICQGYSAILIPQLMSSTYIPIDADTASWIASLGAISNPLGSILSGVLAEIFGRRRSMQISSVPFIVGWITIGTASDITWLYAGRLITGVAAGMATACYTYVAEISTPENRGILQALGPISASLGILLTYSLGYALPWHIIAYGSVLFGLITLIGIQFVPESPSWLIKKERNNQTFSSLVWFRRSVSIAQIEYDELLANKNSVAINTPLKAYFKKGTMKPFFILIVLFLCQELAGIYTILYYAVMFFKDSNIQLDEYIASMIVGFIRFIMSIFAAFLISKFARKNLCMISASGMAFFMVIAASYIKYYEIHPDFERQWAILPLICFLFNVFFSMVGMLPIPWILVGELFNLEVRGIMSGLVVCIAQFAIFLCVKIHPNIVEYLNFSGALFIFAGASIFTVFFSRCFLPETKDMTLADIQNYFENKKEDPVGVDNPGFCIKSENLGSRKNEDSSKIETKVEIL